MQHVDLRLSMRHNAFHLSHFAAWTVLKRPLFSPDARVIITHAHHISFMNRRTEHILLEQTSGWSKTKITLLLTVTRSVLMRLHWCGSDMSCTPILQRCRWGGGVLTACTRQTSVEHELLPSWPPHVQPACTIHSPPTAESSSSYTSKNPNTS